MEEWREVRGYEGIYEVSNIGSLKSLARKSSIGRRLKEKVLRGYVSSSGYLSVPLSKNGTSKTRQVHQLVAIAFLGHTPCGCTIVVDHIDNDKSNNTLDNLQLITHRENSSKDKKGGSSKYVGVNWDKNASKWKAQICTSGKYKHLGLFTDEIEASRAYQSKLKEITNETI